MTGLNPSQSLVLQGPSRALQPGIPRPWPQTTNTITVEASLLDCSPNQDMEYKQPVTAPKSDANLDRPFVWQRETPGGC